MSVIMPEQKRSKPFMAIRFESTAGQSPSPDKINANDICVGGYMVGYFSELSRRSER